MSGLALSGRQSVHVHVATHLIYVRRSYKETTAADVSDELQEAACRALVPQGAPVRVISDTGGHQSGYSAERDGWKALLATIASGQAASVAASLRAAGGSCSSPNSTSDQMRWCPISPAGVVSGCRCCLIRRRSP